MNVHKSFCLYFLKPGLIKHSFAQVGVILSLGFTARIKRKVNDLTEVGFPAQPGEEGKKRTGVERLIKKRT